MNTNKWRNFQICISVPLKHYILCAYLICLTFDRAYLNRILWVLDNIVLLFCLFRFTSNCLKCTKDYNFHPFVPNAPFPYPLKTSENTKVFWCFQGVRKGCIGNKCVKKTWGKTKCWRSIHQRCSVKKGILKNFTGKYLCWSLF